MAATDQQVQPAANRIMAAARDGVPQPGPISAQAQVLYDQSYGPCMAARGNILAVSGAGQGRAAGNVTYTGLTDPDSIAARQTLAGTIEGFRRDCEGERIEVSTLETVLSTSSRARTVTLTTPSGGNCFGQPGQNAYLVAKVGSAWRTLLSAEPGSIQISATAHNGYGDAEVHSLGSCIYYYRWDGSRYVKASAKDCATAVPSTMSTLPRAMRRNCPTACHRGSTSSAIPLGHVLVLMQAETLNFHCRNTTPGSVVTIDASSVSRLAAASFATRARVGLPGG